MPINAHDSFSRSLPLASNSVKLYVRDVLLYLALVGGLLLDNENKEKAAVNKRSSICSF